MLKDILERVQVELKELDTKLDTLDSFLESDATGKLSVEHHTLLEDQSDAMSEYSIILNKRIVLLRQDIEKENADS